MFCCDSSSDLTFWRWRRRSRSSCRCFFCSSRPVWMRLRRAWSSAVCFALNFSTTLDSRIWCWFRIFSSSNASRLSAFSLILWASAYSFCLASVCWILRRLSSSFENFGLRSGSLWAFRMYSMSSVPCRSFIASSKSALFCSNSAMRLSHSALNCWNSNMWASSTPSLSAICPASHRFPPSVL
eukprot:07505_5